MIIGSESSGSKKVVVTGMSTKERLALRIDYLKNKIIRLGDEKIDAENELMQAEEEYLNANEGDEG